MTNKKRLAIICGGGPAPGMNSVISAVTMEANKQGIEVLGMYDGFSHLAKGEKNYVILNYDMVSRIHLNGGCILHMSRYNPTKQEDDLKRVVDTLIELNVSYMVTIGGDDTSFSASKVSEYARKCGKSIASVHVPKTIDNDLPLPEGISTFGFETARALGTTELENLMEDARTTNNRWYFAIAMGRTAGHLALGMGKSAGAIITIIPEEFKTKEVRLQHIVDLLVGSIVKRNATGRNYGVAVIAEGVIDRIAPEDFSALGAACFDDHGHLRYSELDFGDVLKKLVLLELKKIGLQVTIVDKEIGYELRCAAPISFDIDYTRSLGYAAVSFLMDGDTDAVVSIQNNKIVPLKYEDIRDESTGKTKVRYVDINSLNYFIATEYMIRLVKEDFADKDKLAALAAEFKLTPERFKEKYEYLVR